MLLLAFLAFGLLCFLIKVAVFLVEYWRVVAVYRENAATNSFTFSGYLYYRAALWFVWTDGAPTKVILGIFTLFVMVGAALYCFLLGSHAGPAGYKIFVWLVSPDGGANEEKLQGAVIGAVISLGGLLIFALVLTFLQDSFNNFLDNLKVGRSPVMESRHIVIVGYTPHTANLLQDLCWAFGSSGGSHFAILSEEPKPDVEDAIRTAGLDLQGSRIICRSGVAHDAAALQTVGVDSCSTVILSPRHDMDNELADAYMMRLLLVLQGNNWPISGKIILSCRLMRNLEHFKLVGGSNLTVVMIDRLLGQLMWQCSRGCGLGNAVQSLLGFRGSEFYVEKVPQHLMGKTVAEATLFYPRAILAGVACYNSGCQRQPSEEAPGKKGRPKLLSKGSFIIGTDAGEGEFDLKLLPDTRQKLCEGDEILLLAEEESHAVASRRPFCRPSGIDAKVVERLDSALRKSEFQLAGKIEHIVILAWHERMFVSMLVEIEKSVSAGAHVYVFAPQSVEDRERAMMLMQHRLGRELHNVTVRHLSGNPESLFQLEHMEPPIHLATRIFVLRDQDEVSPDRADTRTLFSILHVRTILEKSGASQGIPIVPELVDMKTGHICQHLRFLDYVNVSDLEAAMLATVALDARVAHFLQAITTKGGGLKFTLRGLEEYLVEPPPRSLSFFDAAYVVSQVGDLLVGWTAPSHEGERSVLVNPPDKGTVRHWYVEEDKLMVLARRR